MYYIFIECNHTIETSTSGTYHYHRSAIRRGKFTRLFCKECNKFVNVTKIRHER